MLSAPETGPGAGYVWVHKKLICMMLRLCQKLVNSKFEGRGEATTGPDLREGDREKIKCAVGARAMSWSRKTLGVK
jgi:hypothetical protein